jgi:type VI secretion system protein ImpH
LKSRYSSATQEILIDLPFEALLPDHSGLQRLVSLIRAFLGFEIGFAVNPVLAGPAVPPL